MRIMLFTSDRKAARAYAEAAEQTGTLRLCSVKNTAQVLERLFRESFDALLSDDPSVLLSQIRQCPVLWPAHIFYLTDMPIEATGLPAFLTFCFPKDSDPKTVLMRIAGFPKEQGDGHDAEAAISRFLQQAGVPVSLSGFACIRLALRLILSKDNLLEVPSVQNLYNIISALTGISPFMAEHAIRHAIDAAWIRADTTELEKLFGYTVRQDRGAPSNGAFLFRAADHIRLTRRGILHDSGRNA